MKSEEVPKRTHKGRFVLSLDDNVLDALDKEIQRIKEAYPDVHPTRASVVRGLLKQILIREIQAVNPQGRTDAYKTLLLEAETWKIKAIHNRGINHQEAAHSAFLMAASRELAAIAALRGPTEVIIAGMLVEVLGLIKAGTDYKHLPDIPTR